MFSFSENEQFFQIYFNKDFLKSEENISIGESEIYIFDSERLKSFINSFKSIQIKHLIKTHDDRYHYKLIIPKFPRKNKTKNSFRFEKNLSECRNNTNDLCVPFFFEKLFKREGKA